MEGHFIRKALRFLAALYGLCGIALAFSQTEEVALRQIVVASEQEAKEVHARLIAGASFEAVASERSREAAASRGGYTGRTRLSDLRPEVRKAIEPVTPGKISDPVRLGNAYVLFQIVPEAESRWIDLDEAGTQALSGGRRPEAIKTFEQALAHAEAASLGDARIARSLEALATAYRLDGRVADAEKVYRRTLALLERMGSPDLDIARVLSGLGMTLARQARFAEAEPFYERARSIREKQLGPDHPETAATLMNIAELYAGLRRFGQAAKLFEESQALLERKLGSSHPAAIAGDQGLQAFRRVLLSELLDRFSTAASQAEFRDAKYISEIRELLPLAPLSERAFVQMKDILVNAGLNEDAGEVLREGLKKYPESRLLRIYLADVLAGTGRTGDAVKVLEEARSLPRPESVDVSTERQQQGIIHQRIGDMQLALTNVEGALAAYRRAIEIDPASHGARVKLGKAYFSSGRLDESQAEFERVLTETPGDADDHLNLSEALLAGGKWERAAAAAEKAIQLGVSDPRALYLLGTALVRSGRREQGQERLQEFTRVEAGFAEAEQRSREINAISVAAAAALRDGNADSAVEQLAQGIKRFPDAPRLHMNLALVQARLGRHTMAVETLESMLKRGLGRPFLIHKNLADEYEILGNREAGARHRKIHLDTRDAELLAGEK